MKALLLSDQINHFHWSMLKSVLLVLSLLPLSHFFMQLWASTEGSSQIVVGFMAISVFSACAILSFYSALKATLQQLHDHNQDSSALEQGLVKAYRYVPMVSLTVMMSYLATQF